MFFVYFVICFPIFDQLMSCCILKSWSIYDNLLGEIIKKIYFVGQRNKCYLICWSKRHNYHTKTSGWWLLLKIKQLESQFGQLIVNFWTTFVIISKHWGDDPHPTSPQSTHPYLPWMGYCNKLLHLTLHWGGRGGECTECGIS